MVGIVIKSDCGIHTECSNWPCIVCRISEGLTVLCWLCLLAAVKLVSATRNLLPERECSGIRASQKTAEREQRALFVN